MACSATKPGGLGACPHYRTQTEPNKPIALATCEDPSEILAELETVDDNLELQAEKDVSYAVSRGRFCSYAGLRGRFCIYACILMRLWYGQIHGWLLSTIHTRKMKQWLKQVILAVKMVYRDGLTLRML